MTDDYHPGDSVQLTFLTLTDAERSVAGVVTLIEERAESRRVTFETPNRVNYRVWLPYDFSWSFVEQQYNSHRWEHVGFLPDASWGLRNLAHTRW